MRPTRKRKEKAVGVITENNPSPFCSGVKKPTKRSSGHRGNAAGQNEGDFAQKDGCSLPPSTGHLLHPKLPDKITHGPQKTAESPVAKLDSRHTFDPSAKIKLQLFPMDEGTRMGLEKDGYYPFLELTLRARKKISSVLKHLSGKWGSSRIALGEPILFPYNLCLDNVAGQRKWTLNDGDISAGDVYASLGSPAIFRLRYGWLCNHEAKSYAVSSTSTPFETCSQSEEVSKGCSEYLEKTCGKEKQLHIISKGNQHRVTEETSAVVTGKKPFDVPVDSLGDKVNVGNNLGNSSVQWDDILTNISIGGLLSEASLQGRFNDCNPKSNGRDLGSQPSQVISDSFDAFIASQVNQPDSLGSLSSILDAENTCHAFSFENFSSSGNNAPAISGSTNLGASIPNAVSKSFRFSNLPEISSQAGVPENAISQEVKADLSLCSQLYNDESSLGLRGIKWSDSLGPFDLGLSSLGKIIGGDSISLNSFVM